MATGDPTDLSEGMQAGVGAAEIGIGAATGNPIAIIGGIAALGGVGASLFGTIGEAAIQKEEAGVSADIGYKEMAINQWRQNLAKIIYQRQSLENFRNTQKAVAMSKAAATNQGAQFGSGAAGGRGATETAGAVNQENLGLDFTTGQNIFNLTSSIDMDKIKLAQLGGQASTYAGIASAGGSITQSMPALMRLAGGFGGGGPANPSGNTGNLGGLY